MTAHTPRVLTAAALGATTLLVLAVLIATKGPSTSAGGSTIAIDSLEVLPPSQEGKQVQTVQFMMGWTGPDFPGVHRCTWTLYGATGATVGSYIDEVFALSSEPRSLTLDIPTTDVAERADASCGPRLDVGTPYSYEFSDIRVRSSGELLPLEAVVSFDAKWEGSAYPGAVQCTLSLIDSGGEAVLTRQSTIVVADGTADDSEWAVRSNLLGGVKLISADIGDCQPFGA